MNENNENVLIEETGKCEHCGREGAKCVANPFLEDVYSEISMEYICDSCYDNLIQEI